MDLPQIPSRYCLRSESVSKERTYNGPETDLKRTWNGRKGRGEEGGFENL